MGEFYGEIEEIPFNLCGVFNERFVLAAPIDDPIERDYAQFHGYDGESPDSLIPRSDVLQNRSDSAVHRTIKVLTAADGRSVHFPRLLLAGKLSGLVFGSSGDQQQERDPEWPERPIAIIQYEGNLLSSLLSTSDNGRLPVPVALMIGIGCVRALAALHRLGFAHRLVSPFSFSYVNPISIQNLKYRMIITDLSLAMQWPAKPRVFAPFVGTQRYSSIRAHQGREQGPSDDIISVIYMVTELIAGKLPWRSFYETSEVREMKKTFYASSEFKRLPREIRSLYRSMILTLGPSPIDHKEVLNYFTKAINRRDPDGTYKLPHYLDV
ncbi:hypothetical protein L596_028312 [Steinernema carpocapsae]|uniref:Protein kinase domain-containing protein n=1 Tax=Steinernema carpocapsae TaxID=34508 RepID=A0A4U5LY22_STECR|nr:hypothetical protein L596_028312 [Steinernema carpocapsae]